MGSIIKKIWIPVLAAAALTASSIEEPISMGRLHPIPGYGTAPRIVEKGGPGGGKYHEVKAVPLKQGVQNTQLKPISRKSFQMWGEKLEYTFRARGKGTLQIGYFGNSERDGKIVYLNKILRSVPLTDQWKKYSMVIRCTDPRVARSYYIEFIIRGEGNYFCLADDSIRSLSPERSGIRAVPEHLVTYPGEKTSVVFTAPKLKSVKAIDGKSKKEKILNGNGTFTIDTSAVADPCGKPDPLTNIAGVGRIGIWEETSGEYKGVFVNRIPKKEWDVLNRTAGKIKLNKPVNILFLGDSLTDYDRGRNYTDKIAFWLNKYNPGKCRFRNAGVGGDTIRSLHDRLTNGRFTWRRNMYAGLWDQKWDLIFIFLGHNDTRYHYRNKGPSYQPVLPEAQKKFLDQTLRFLKSKTAARIVLLTPGSLDHRQCVKAVGSAKKAGRNYVVFGEVPRLEKYCAVVKEIAGKHAVDVIDVYTPMKALPNKPDLFTKPDGVHLTSAGNNYISGHILQYFTKVYKK